MRQKDKTFSETLLNDTKREKATLEKYACKSRGLENFLKREKYLIRKISALSFLTI